MWKETGRPRENPRRRGENVPTPHRQWHQPGSNFFFFSSTWQQIGIEQNDLLYSSVLWQCKSSRPPYVNEGTQLFSSKTIYKIMWPPDHKGFGAQKSFSLIPGRPMPSPELLLYSFWKCCWRPSPWNVSPRSIFKDQYSTACSKTARTASTRKSIHVMLFVVLVD